MRENTRASASFSQDPRGDGGTSFFLPLAISLVCHLVFMVIFVVSPSLRAERPPARSVINVSMVSLKNPVTRTAEKPDAPPKPPKISKPAVAKKTPSVPPKKKTVKAVKKTPPKPKTSLKKKTFKPTRVVKPVAKPPPEKADAQSEPQPEPLKSALERLKKEVSEAETDRSTASVKPKGSTTGKSGTKPGPFNEDGKKTAELIDLYRLEVAFQIQKNWAFNEQLAGGDRSLVAAIVFKVMPDGEVRDIFFTDRSGNTYLDESGYKAIVKSNPVDRHPPGLVQQPYVVMAIRFTPQGLR